MKPSGARRRGPWLLVAAFLIIAVAVSAAGYVAWRAQSRSAQHQAEESLVTIGHLKADQVSDWLAERRADAEVVRANRLLGDAVARLRTQPRDRETRARVETLLAATQRSYDYVDVVVVDPRGEILVRAPSSSTHALDATARDLVMQSIVGDRVELSDLHLNAVGEPRLDVICPVIAGRGAGQKTVAAMLFHVDPSRFLYPLIQFWPTPSRSGETLLVERQGEDVVYLNDLRFRAHAALTLRVPASDPNLPAARAVAGRTGIMQGTDYRGATVLADLRPVPGTDWFIVSKVDRDEVQASIRTRGWLIAGLTTAIVLVVGLGVLLLWRSREAQMSLAVAENERKFHETVQDLDEGYYSVTIDGELLEHNPAYSRIFGIDADLDLRGQKTPPLFQDPADRTAYVRELTSAGSVRNYVVNAKTIDGDKIVVMVNAHIVRDRHGDPARIEGTMTDVTDRQRAEEAVRLGARIAEIFLTHSDDEMYGEVLDVVMETMQCEYGLFGYLDTEGNLVAPSLTRHAWDQCQVPDKRLVFPRDTWGDSGWPTAIREKRVVVSNEPAIHVPEGHIPIRRSISLPIVFNDEAIGLFQVANKDSDYTAADVAALEGIAGQVAPILAVRLQRHRSEEEIARLNAGLEERVLDRTAELDTANHDLEAFAYSVSHDLRAPLRHVIGFSQLLATHAGEELDDTGRHYLDTISKAVHTMGVLIDDLLEFSRGRRGEMHLTVVDMDALMHEIVDSLSEDGAGRAVEWTTDALPDAYGDAALLRQVWVNLLGNALKFTRGRDPARIELGARQDAEQIIYFVRDNGVGFDMTYVDKLFGVFQRLHSSSEFEGTGIGLATVRRIITRLGGNVWAEGKVDEGATFFFSLPQPKETSP